MPAYVRISVSLPYRIKTRDVIKRSADWGWYA